VNMTSDLELLRNYAKTRSEEAFAELVRRHVNLVYSAALRQVGGDAHLAQDAAQTVFADLARKAASLCRRESLTGWLYTSAHFAAANIARGEHRRRDREEQFMREPIQDTGTTADWEKLRPTLDSVMHELKESDREAVLLRYFENRPFAEVGARVSVNENTARMRVERALEKLRSLLAKRGITTGAALASVISANAVQTAPASLAGSLATAALSSAGTGAFSFFQAMNMATFKIGLGALATAGVVAALVVQLRAQKTSQAANESLSGQIAQLKADNTELSNQIAANANSLETQKDQSDELLKLRAEVTQLRAMKTVPAVAASRAMNGSPAKKLTPQIHLSVKFVSIPTWTMPSFGAGWTAAGPDTSLLSEEQFGVVKEAIRNKDVDEMGAPQVVTFSGNEVRFSVSKQVSIDNTNADIGIKVSAVPYFSSYATNVTLNLVAKLIQLTGDASQPGVATTQLSNQVSLVPDQTAVLKANMPANSWLSDSNAPTVTEPRNLLVFVTPVLIDRVGNRVDIKGETAEANTNPAMQDSMEQKMSDGRRSSPRVSATGPANPADSDQPPKKEMLMQAGSINFVNVNLSEFLRVYAEFANAQVDTSRLGTLPPVLVQCNNTNAMTRTQLVQFLEQTLYDQAGIVATHPDATRVVLARRSSTSGN
jgi:RNA polymerase sigma factor (sigma-70 family)